MQVDKGYLSLGSTMYCACRDRTLILMWDLEVADSGSGFFRLLTKALSAGRVHQPLGIMTYFFALQGNRAPGEVQV